jgi:FHS family L-fucose permease-like MFS transporter
MRRNYTLTTVRTYPLCVNFVPAYRNVADSFSATDIGVANAHAHDPELAKDESPAHTEAVDLDKTA